MSTGSEKEQTKSWKNVKHDHSRASNYRAQCIYIVYSCCHRSLSRSSFRYFKSYFLRLLNTSVSLYDSKWMYIYPLPFASRTFLRTRASEKHACCWNRTNISSAFYKSNFKSNGNHACKSNFDRRSHNCARLLLT